MINYGIDIENEIKCMPSTMYIEDFEYGERKTDSGLLIQAETMSSSWDLIRPRWGRVLYKADNITDINVGDFVLQKWGHWSTYLLATINGKTKKIWYISPKSYKEGTLAVSKSMPKYLKEYGIKEK